MNYRPIIRTLPKEEILDTIDMILELLADKEEFRPRLADSVHMEILKLKEQEIPREIGDQIKEHESEMKMFIQAIETLCQEAFPVEFKRLKDCHPDIVERVIKHGEARSDLVLLRRRLELNEAFNKTYGKF